MRVLVLNSGSSSLKFRLFEVAGNEADNHLETIRPTISGVVQGIGDVAVLQSTMEDATGSRDQREIRDHTQAVQWVFEHLRAGEADALGPDSPARVDAVGHRMVHGGERFRQAVRLDAEVLAEIERFNELAPLHNPACLAGGGRSPF